MSYKNPLIYVNRYNPTCPSCDCVVPVNYPVYRSLCINEMTCSYTGETAYSYADDIQLLLMQKNYMANSPYDYSQFIASMSKNTVKPVSKPKMTDKQLLSYIKSRHIQSPSELQSWLNYLSSRMSNQLLMILILPINLLAILTLSIHRLHQMLVINETFII